MLVCTIGGKTGKTVVLPGFCKIERGGGSGGAPLCKGVLSGLGACSMPVASLPLMVSLSIPFNELPSIRP